jgi:TP901 family phage tail tape measure protein
MTSGGISTRASASTTPKGEKRRIDFVVGIANMTWPGIAAVASGFANLTAVGMRTANTLTNSMKASQAAMMAAGGFAALALGAATAEAIKFEKEMRVVEALISNTEFSKEKTVGTLEEMTKSAKSMASAYGMAPVEIAKGMKVLGRAGIDNITDMNTVMSASIQLAKIEGISMESAAKMTIQMTNLFSGSYARDAEQFATILAHAANISTTSAEEIMVGLRHAGGIAATVWNSRTAEEIYQNASDVATMIAILSQQGVTGSMAGTAIKSFMNYQVKNMPKSKKALSELGLNTGDLRDPETGQLLRFNQTLDLFSNQLTKKYGPMEGHSADWYSWFVRWGEPRQAQQYMKMFQPDEKLNIPGAKETWHLYDTYRDKMDQEYDMKEKVNTIMSSTAEKLNQVGAAFQVMGISIGEKLLPVINIIVSVIQGLADFIANNQIASWLATLTLLGLVTGGLVSVGQWLAPAVAQLGMGITSMRQGGGLKGLFMPQRMQEDIMEDILIAQGGTPGMAGKTRPQGKTGGSPATGFYSIDGDTKSRHGAFKGGSPADAPYVLREARKKDGLPVLPLGASGETKATADAKSLMKSGAIGESSLSSMVPFVPVGDVGGRKGPYSKGMKGQMKLDALGARPRKEIKKSIESVDEFFKDLPQRAYMNEKQANKLFVSELSRRWGYTPSSIGGVPTNSVYSSLLGKDLRQGASWSHLFGTQDAVMMSQLSRGVPGSEFMNRVQVGDLKGLISAEKNIAFFDALMAMGLLMPTDTLLQKQLYDKDQRKIRDKQKKVDYFINQKKLEDYKESEKPKREKGETHKEYQKRLEDAKKPKQEKDAIASRIKEEEKYLKDKAIAEERKRLEIIKTREKNAQMWRDIGQANRAYYRKQESMVREATYGRNIMGTSAIVDKTDPKKHKATGMKSAMGEAFMAGAYYLTPSLVAQNWEKRGMTPLKDMTLKEKLKYNANVEAQKVKKAGQSGLAKAKGVMVSAGTALAGFIDKIVNVAKAHPALLAIAAGAIAAGLIIYEIGRQYYWWTSDKELGSIVLKEQEKLVAYRKKEYDKYANKEQTLINQRRVMGRGYDDAELKMIQMQKEAAKIRWEEQVQSYKNWKTKIDEYKKGPSKLQASISGSEAASHGTPEWSSPMPGYQAAAPKGDTSASRAMEERIKNSWWKKEREHYKKSIAPFNYAAVMGEKAVGYGDLKSKDAAVVGKWLQTAPGQLQLNELQDLHAWDRRRAAAAEGKTYDPATGKTKDETDVGAAMIGALNPIDFFTGIGTSSAIFSKQNQIVSSAWAAQNNIGTQQNTYNQKIVINGANTPDEEMGGKIGNAIMTFMTQATPISSTNYGMFTNTAQTQTSTNNSNKP